MSNVRSVWPLLWVSDVEESISFWTDGMGFAVAGANGPPGVRDWCRVVRGGTSVMLQGGPVEKGPRGVALYLLCDDVEDLREEVVGRGLSLSGPTMPHTACVSCASLTPTGTRSGSSR